MGIDVNEWASRLMSAQSKLLHREPFTPTIELFVDICRAIIADEAAKDSAPQQKEPTTVSYERFTDRARKVMQLANQEAQRFNHEYIGTEHVAIGLVKEHAGVARFVLNKAGIDVCKIRLEVERLVKSGPDMALMGKLPYTPRTKQVLQFAIEESRALGHLYVGTEHILLGLLREREGIGGQVIRGLGLSLEDARRALKDVLGEQHDKDSAPAASGPEHDEPAEREDGVPEWFMEILGLCYTMGHDRSGGLTLAAKGWWPIVEAEIARRTAELTTERDQALAEAEKFKATDVGTLVADAIRADRESDERECRREIRRLRAEAERLKARQIPDGWEMSGTLGDSRRRIAELEAEVERLTSGKWTPQEVNDLCHDLPKVVGPRAYADGCAKQQRELFGCAPDADRIAELEARVADQAKEIERLSRPVDLGAVHKTRVDGIDYVYGYDAQQAVRLERNAREVAESALAEFRELVRTHYLMWTAADASAEWSFLKRLKSCPEDDLDAALAKFRKTKEQAK